MPGSTALAAYRWAITCSSHCCCQTAFSASVSSPLPPAPAFEQNTSTAPCLASVASTRAMICASSVTSQAIPSQPISAAARFTASSFRSANITALAPSRKNAVAIALPIPPLPPVITATLSRNSIILPRWWQKNSAMSVRYGAQARTPCRHELNHGGDKHEWNRAQSIIRKSSIRKN